MQMDKGSKLGVPMFKIQKLWYKSRSWILVEHATDTSRADGGRRTCYMWEESTGAGGSNNMISVLYYHLCHYPSGRKGLTLWLDNCWHELKNWDFVFFLVWLVVVLKMFDFIEVKYYESGHSFMGGYGPDSTHAKITLAARDVDAKVIPEHWFDIARTCSKGQLTVVEFDLQHHRNFNKFVGQYFRVQTQVDGQRNVDVAGHNIALPDYSFLRILPGKDSGLVYAYEGLTDQSPEVVIETLKVRYPKNCVDDPLHPTFDTVGNPLRVNAVKGVMAAWTYMKPNEKVVWKDRLVGTATKGIDKSGDLNGDVITEEKFTDLLNRVLTKKVKVVSSSEESNTGESGDEHKVRRLEKRARTKAAEKRENILLERRTKTQSRREKWRLSHRTPGISSDRRKPDRGGGVGDGDVQGGLHAVAGRKRAGRPKGSKNKQKNKKQNVVEV